MTDVLSQRGLNGPRWLASICWNARRHGRSTRSSTWAGCNPRRPLAPYVGLWTRLRGFAPDELSALTEERQVVRLHLMRNTVHLVSARDCLDWRALLRQAKRLLEEQPRTRSELGDLLAQRWPDADPSALAYAATHHIALCQVPPRRIWGAGTALSRRVRSGECR